MTSSLPNLPAAPAPAGAASVNPASLAGLSDAGRAPAGDFADLMSDADAAAELYATATAMPNFTILAPTMFTLVAPPATTAESAYLAGLSPAELAAEFPSPANGEISRDTMEQAASFLATILQSVLPEAVPPPPASAGLATSAPAATSASFAAGVEGTRPRVPGSTDQAALAPETLATPVSTPATVTTSAMPAPSASVTPAPDATVSPYQFEATLAADGAVEINATLPPVKEQGSTGKSAAASASAGLGLEIQAELELPGRAVIRLSAAGSAAGELPGRAKFAGKIPAEKYGEHSSASAVERNFLVAGDKEVNSESPLTGITVAKTQASMKNVPTEATRATSNQDVLLGLSARGEFSVPVERAGATAVAPLEQNFAERAVATVANLVDTQFTASMQKSGSVQLRLRFGGEDLNVRVELRHGEVHTDFRTDSPELRAALNREWQAVASESADALRRFVEPVFSPSTSSGGDSSSSFARQQAAQQDLSQQRQARARDEDVMTFTRRALVGETFTPQPAAPRAPALVPTSVRLSVLA